MHVDGIDHLVLTVEDVERTCEFYERLGAEVVTFDGGRTALRAGEQKINLHESDAEYDPHAATPAPGSGDFCLLTETAIGDVAAELRDAGVELVEGPVRRTGARGPMDSVYVRDPDGNLVEVASYR